MKKIFLLLLIAAVGKLHAQTADEIIKKYADAMGGLDNFKNVKTAKFTGTASAQGNAFPITIQIINGKAMRTDVEVMDKTIVNAYKDGKGWKINPYAGAPTPTDATADELSEFKSDSFLPSELMDYKARGDKAELVGPEDVNGSKAYKIQLTSAENKTDTYYVDGATYMVVKFVGTRNIMGQDMQLETYFSDVKDVDNLKFSMGRSVRVGGQTLQDVHFDKIELDVPIDEKIFDKP